MRKRIVAISVLLFGAMHAQQSSIKVNPISVIAGGGNDLLSYERKFSDHSTGGVGAGFTSFKSDGDKYYSIGGSLFYRYYTKEAFRGFYASGLIGVGGGNRRYDTYYFVDGTNTGLFAGEGKDKFTTFGFGGKLGYQWVWKSGFTLDLNAGLSYMFFSYKGDRSVSDARSAKANGILPALGVALGYSF